MIQVRRIHRDYDGSIYLQMELYPLDDATVVRVMQELHDVLTGGSSRVDAPAAQKHAPGAAGLDGSISPR